MTLDDAKNTLRDASGEPRFLEAIKTVVSALDRVEAFRNRCQQPQAQTLTLTNGDVAAALTHILRHPTLRPPQEDA